MSRTGTGDLVQVREYGSVPYSRLGASTVQALERLTHRLGVPVFRFLRHELRARQYVGFVRAGGKTVQILPKVYGQEREDLAFLVFLLGYTRSLDLKPTGTAGYERANGSLLEIWIRSFAVELNRLLRHHPRRAYVEVEEEVGHLRGKILTERMRAARERVTGKYPCRYEVFTADHLLNQGLKHCNRLLLRTTNAAGTRTLLAQNDVLLAEVEGRAVALHDLQSIHLDRLNHRYEPVLAMCRLLLGNSALDLRAGSITQLAFIFDMNRLFEGFVYELLRRHLPEIRLADGSRYRSVVPQHHLGRLFGEFGMQVDLRLEHEHGRAVLVDTKYKVLDEGKAHGGLALSDFYQMYAYGKAGDRPHEHIIVLYPATGLAPRAFTSGALRVHVRQVDLRRMFDASHGRLDPQGAVRELNQALSIEF